MLTPSRPLLPPSIFRTVSEPDGCSLLTRTKASVGLEERISFGWLSTVTCAVAIVDFFLDSAGEELNLAASSQMQP
jgi:hypothetical protein